MITIKNKFRLYILVILLGISSMGLYYSTVKQHAHSNTQQGGTLGANSVCDSQLCNTLNQETTILQDTTFTTSSLYMYITPSSFSFNTPSESEEIFRILHRGTPSLYTIYAFTLDNTDNSVRQYFRDIDNPTGYGFIQRATSQFNVYSSDKLGLLAGGNYITTQTNSGIYLENDYTKPVYIYNPTTQKPAIKITSSTQENLITINRANSTISNLDIKSFSDANIHFIISGYLRFTGYVYIGDLKEAKINNKNAFVDYSGENYTGYVSCGRMTFTDTTATFSGGNYFTLHTNTWTTRTANFSATNIKMVLIDIYSIIYPVANQTGLHRVCIRKLGSSKDCFDTSYDKYPYSLHHSVYNTNTIEKARLWIPVDSNNQYQWLYAYAQTQVEGINSHTSIKEIGYCQ